MSSHGPELELLLAFEAMRPGGPFPFEAFRKARFANGTKCPRCGSASVQRWGWFSGRRRYRCRGCQRTFSDFTGTPLAYLKRIEDWPRFGQCVVAELSIRRSGRFLSVDPSTAFRWRHRLLAALNDADGKTPLWGQVVVHETRFPYSEKGRRRPDPTAFRFARPGTGSARTAWVVVAGDGADGTFATLIGLRRPAARDLVRALGRKLRHAAGIMSGTGQFGAAGTAATRLGLLHRRLPSRADELTRLRHYVVRLRRWMRQFRGVATRYLDHYLVWHRLAEPRGSAEMFRLFVTTSAVSSA